MVKKRQYHRPNPFLMMKLKKKKLDFYFDLVFLFYLHFGFRGALFSLSGFVPMGFPDKVFTEATLHYLDFVLVFTYISWI